MGTIVRQDYKNTISYPRSSGHGVAEPTNSTAEAVVFVRVNSATKPDATFQFTPGFHHIKKITLVRIITEDGLAGTRSILIYNGFGDSLFPYNRVAADAAPRLPVYPVNTELDLPIAFYRDATGSLEGHIQVIQSNFDGTPVSDSQVCIVLRLELASWQ